MRNLTVAASILSTLAIASVAQADTFKPVVPDDGTIETFEVHSESSSSSRTITTRSPIRAVVETSWSRTFDETWSHSYYEGMIWTTDHGDRSEAVYDQRTTIRKLPPRRPLRIDLIPQRSPTIGSQSPCSSSRIRCCAE